MKFSLFSKPLLLTAGLALTLSACGPKENLALQRAQLNLQNTKNNNAVMTYSPALVNEADELYQRAEREWREKRNHDEVEHLAYLTERKLDIAREDARRKVALNLADVHRDQARSAAVDLKLQEQEAQVRATTNAIAAERYRALAADNRVLVEALRRDVAALQARETERGLELTLMEDVLFETGKSELKPGALLKLRPVISFLKENPHRTVTIEGHTDNVGGESYNQLLSQRRADAVRTLFITEGLSGSQVLSRGFGESYPLAPNSTEAGRQQNRRVQIVISSHA